MLADLPPSSITIGLSVAAHAACSLRAVTVPPVKLILSTPGWLTSAFPTSGPPVTTLTTPGGMPASRQSRPKVTGENGASSGDLITRQQPAARAGAPPMAQNPSGPFQVTMSPTTPTGSGTVKSMPSNGYGSMLSPVILSAHPA